ncbi:MAG: ABC transporter ATP-binding protein [Burkholderiales bacterium]
MSTQPMLRVAGLAVAYGGIRAIKGIDFEINAGETVTLIGANGAGKTTTLRAITGLIVPVAGSIEFEGHAVAGASSFSLVRRGLAMVPEGRGVFPQLTVAENVAMGAYIRDDKAAIANDVERVFGLFPRLRERSRQSAGTLSGGEQQMLAIGRALMSRPKLLLLDEPSMGLAPVIVQKVFEVIEAIAREGVTMLLVEQNANLALRASHRAYVLESGLITLSGKSSDLLADPKVRAAYLGE